MGEFRSAPRAPGGRWWRVTTLAAVIIAVAVVTRLCVFVVSTTEFALVTEFGKPVQVIKAPGLAAKFPYQTIRKFDRRLFVYTPPASEFLTLEKTPVVAAPTIWWRIADPKTFFETVFDRTGAESRLGDIVFAEMGAAIGRSPLSAFVSTEADAYRAEAIIGETAKKARDVALRDYGIDLTQIALQSFDFPTQNQARLYARMKSERGQLSMKYRSEGEEEGLKVRAAAEEEKTHIVSEALKLSQQRRGEGEGEAARIYAEAYGEAPDFYHFLRTMEASRNLFHKGTTLVLGADSELFGLLYDSHHFERREGSASVSDTSERERNMK
jgi:membrane protease subunit HflC